ncbi:hypothetical protein FA95DRAFT_127746 [Auriscalpium vulgare]|uniref:Uncharacterized protein n=1 Tax=Auriscalpium vulgare TaxID=40419 RepID=A0ACB8RN29_9AGAM|nr:hypothetical protein FA95DRAFT_127746 [Auriscalpium vulgare]
MASLSTSVADQYGPTLKDAMETVSSASQVPSNASEDACVAVLDALYAQVSRLEASFYGQAPSSEMSKGIWTWDYDARLHWKEAPEAWQSLYAYYRVTANAEAALSQPMIHLFPGAKPEMSFLVDTLDQILMRESYRKLLDRILELQESRPEKGVVITGQPGIGKSIFLCVLLIKILGRGEPVVFGWKPRRLYLFYNGKVYTPRIETVFDFTMLPQGAEPMWALIDALCVGGMAPEALADAKIFLVLSSAFPIGDDIRMGRREALIWGIPLWSREELVEGLKLHRYYEKLRGLVVARQNLEHNDALLQYINDALALLSNLGESAAHSAAGNTVEPTADNVIPVMIELAVEQVGFIPREVCRILWQERHLIPVMIELAVEQVGFIPREVCRILWQERHLIHATAIATSNTIVEAISVVNAGGLPTTEFLERASKVLDSICITPTADCSIDRDDQFTIAFKSVSVEQQLTKACAERLDTLAERIFSTCENFPAVRWAFETMAHCRLRQGGTLELHKMNNNGGDPPVFTTATTPPASSSYKLTMRAREAVTLDFSKPGFDVSEEEYYASASNNTPFDAFFVDTSGGSGGDRRVTVWVLQMTTANEHGGSEHGYIFIRNVIEAVRRRAEVWKEGGKKHDKQRAKKRVKVEPTVQVNYVLVCPDDGKPRTWQFPSGWTDNATQADHRGDVYCVRIPMAVLRVKQPR